MTTDYLRIYARQEYMTPGAADTVEMLAEAARPGEHTILLEVACGKGEAACSLTGRFGCRVVALDAFEPFIRYTAAKVQLRGLTHMVLPVRGDGNRLPVRTAAFDAAYCIGAPSIVGLETCLRELARAVKSGGHVVVSDIVWRRKPEGPLGPEWGEVAEFAPRLSQEEYAAALEAADLQVLRVLIHPRSAWGDYHCPIGEVFREARASGDIDFAKQGDVSLTWSAAP